MKEDIKILEEFINRCRECKFATCEQCEINWRQIQAIEYLINKVKSQDKQIKLMQSINITENFIEKSKVREKIEEIDEILALEPVGNKLEELLTKRKTYIEILQEGDDK